MPPVSGGSGTPLQGWLVPEPKPAHGTVPFREQPGEGGEAAPLQGGFRWGFSLGTPHPGCPPTPNSSNLS